VVDFQGVREESLGLLGKLGSFSLSLGRKEREKSLPLSGVSA
jgi:hypothetical protein